MTDVNGVNTNEDSNPQDSSPKEEFVPKNAYKQVSDDMHKYKARLKETEAKLNEYQAKLESEEKAKLEKEKQWEDLYRASEEKVKQLQSEHQGMKTQFVDSHKVNALLQELGGVSKPEYIKHANLKAIEILEDGSICADSLKKEADRFRQEHAPLLKNVKMPKVPNDAPKTITDKMELRGEDKHRAALESILSGGVK